MVSNMDLFRVYQDHIHCALKHMSYASELISLITRYSLLSNINDIVTAKRQLDGLYASLVIRLPDIEELVDVAVVLANIRNVVIGTEAEEGRFNVRDLLRSYLCFAIENAGENLEKAIRIKNNGFEKADNWVKTLLKVQGDLSKIVKVFPNVNLEGLVDAVRYIRGEVSRIEKEVSYSYNELKEVIKGSNIEMALLEELKDLKSALYMCEKLGMLLLRGVNDISVSDLINDLIGNLLASERHVVEVFISLWGRGSGNEEGE